MIYLAFFFAGAFLCNGIPHLVSGLLGAPFPTPFAKPSGVGDSSPLVNFLWGALNICVGIFILSGYPVHTSFNAPFIALLVGALLMGVFTSLHFGKVRHRKNPR